MKKYCSLFLAVLLIFMGSAFAADVKVTALPEASSVTGTDIIPVVVNPGTTPVTKKATVSVLGTYFSGSFQAYSAILASLAGTTPLENRPVLGNATGGLKIAANPLAVDNSTNGHLVKKVVVDEVHSIEDATAGSDYVYPIANATATLGTAKIASGACASAVTVSATGVATTDVIDWGFNADPTSITGYSASVNGMLTIIAYPTANNVNFKVCNNTAAAITPGAVVLNWRVRR